MSTLTSQRPFSLYRRPGSQLVYLDQLEASILYLHKLEARQSIWASWRQGRLFRAAGCHGVYLDQLKLRTSIWTSQRPGCLFKPAGCRVPTKRAGGQDVYLVQLQAVFLFRRAGARGSILISQSVYLDQLEAREFLQKRFEGQVLKQAILSMLTGWRPGSPYRRIGVQIAQKYELDPRESIQKA